MCVFEIHTDTHKSALKTVLRINVNKDIFY